VYRRHSCAEQRASTRWAQTVEPPSRDPCAGVSSTRLDRWPTEKLGRARFAWQARPVEPRLGAAAAGTKEPASARAAAAVAGRRWGHAAKEAPAKGGRRRRARPSLRRRRALPRARRRRRAVLQHLQGLAQASRAGQAEGQHAAHLALRVRLVRRGYQRAHRRQDAALRAAGGAAEGGGHRRGGERAEAGALPRPRDSGRGYALAAHRCFWDFSQLRPPSASRRRRIAGAPLQPPRCRQPPPAAAGPSVLDHAAAAGRLPVEARGPAAALCSYRPGRASAAAGGRFYGWGSDAEARGVALGVAGRQHGCFVSGGALRRVASSPTRATPRRREGRACGRAGGRGRDGQPPSG